ncbi:MAG: PilZ domain-containing protein [Myxococcota bacterium]
MDDKKRQHPRIDSDIHVTVRLADGCPTNAGRIRNLSLGGVFIEMEPLAFGATMQLVFTLPDGARPLTCTGYVVWSTKVEPKRAAGMDGNGIRLTDISVSDMRLLSDYVSKHLGDA